MNKLTLDEIGFIKKKIENFIAMPSSPKRQPSPKKNDSSKSFQSPNVQKSKQSNNKISQGMSEEIKENQKWLQKKQMEIMQFINHQNRNKESVLNKFLNSEKIQLKKREDVDKQFNSRNTEKQRLLQDNSQSKSFSFDNELSSLKKVYNNIGSILAPKEVEQNIKSQKFNKINQNPFPNMLKNMDQNQQQTIKVKKQTIYVEKQSVLVKPSTLKGRLFGAQKQQVETPRMAQKETKSARKTSIKRDSIVENQNSKKIIINTKSPQNSELSVQKRNKSSSFSNIKSNVQSKSRQNSNVKKDNKNAKVISGTHSKKSFQFFDSQRPSTIRAPTQMTVSDNFKRNQNTQFYSPSKNHLSTSQQKFPASVYKKSFKNSPYQLSNYQKFYINKYRSKQLSPDQRKGLKQKYELLDKRLTKILSNVASEKQNLNQSFGCNPDAEKQIHFQKTQIPEQILAYQKLSPLKKILKVNKELRMKYQSEFQKD